MRLFALLLAGAVVVAVASIPATLEAQTLSRYEDQALKRALAQRNLEIDPAPTGKRVAAIIVDNQPVFSPRDGFLTAFNFFHVTTKEAIIEREVLVRPGESWDEELIAESRRKITDPLYTTLVVIAAVKTPDPAAVDLLVVTRDIWSLRLNTLYEFQQSKLTQLSFSVSENNLFGFRKTAALAFSMDQGDIFVGPIYIDKNIRGTRLRFSSSAGGLFARSDGAFEGTRSTTSLSYPLWSSRSKWAADIGVSHFIGKVRVFDGTELEVYDNPDTADEEAVPFIYDLRNFNVEGGVTRSFGSPFIQRVRVGYDLAVNRPEVPDGFAFDDVTRDAFVRDRFPRSERASSVFLRYSAFLNQFKVYRNVDTYDLPEDVRIGPSFSAVVASSLKLIGSEENFLTGSMSLTHTQPIGEGLISASGSVSARLEKIDGDNELIDQVFSASAVAATPMLVELFRLVAHVSYTARLKDRANRFFRLGGENGLRGFAINQFAGDRRVLGNLELRSIPFKLWFGRVGGLVFYDVGHAAQTNAELRLRHDIGFGFRTLVPQLQRTVFRFDLAIGLNGVAPGATPIRFTSGIQQVF